MSQLNGYVSDGLKKAWERNVEEEEACRLCFRTGSECVRGEKSVLKNYIRVVEILNDCRFVREGVVREK
jgi:hypothetical protein